MINTIYYDTVEGTYTVLPDPFKPYGTYAPIEKGKDMYVESWQTNIKDRCVRLGYDRKFASEGDVPGYRKEQANRLGVVLHDLVSLTVPAEEFDLMIKCMNERIRVC